MEGAQIEKLQGRYAALQADSDEEDEDVAAVLGNIISEPEQRSLEVEDLAAASGGHEPRAAASTSPTPPQPQPNQPSQRTASGSVSVPNLNVGNVSPISGVDKGFIPTKDSKKATSAPPGMKTNPEFQASPATAREAIRANILQQQAAARSSVPMFQPNPINSSSGQVLESTGNPFDAVVSPQDQQSYNQQNMQQQFSPPQFYNQLPGSQYPIPGSVNLESSTSRPSFPGQFPQMPHFSPQFGYGSQFVQGFPMIGNGFQGQFGYSGAPGPYPPVQFSPEHAWSMKSKLVTSDSKQQSHERKVKWISDAVKLLRVFEPTDTEAEIKKFFKHVHKEHKDLVRFRQFSRSLKPCFDNVPKLKQRYERALKCQEVQKLEKPSVGSEGLLSRYSKYKSDLHVDSMDRKLVVQSPDYTLHFAAFQKHMIGVKQRKWDDLQYHKFFTPRIQQKGDQDWADYVLEAEDEGFLVESTSEWEVSELQKFQEKDGWFFVQHSKERRLLWKIMSKMPVGHLPIMGIKGQRGVGGIPNHRIGKFQTLVDGEEHELPIEYSDGGDGSGMIDVISRRSGVSANEKVRQTNQDTSSVADVKVSVPKRAYHYDGGMLIAAVCAYVTCAAVSVAYVNTVLDINPEDILLEDTTIDMDISPVFSWNETGTATVSKVGNFSPTGYDWEQPLRQASQDTWDVATPVFDVSGSQYLDLNLTSTVMIAGSNVVQSNVANVFGEVVAIHMGESLEAVSVVFQDPGVYAIDSESEDEDDDDDVPPAVPAPTTPATPATPNTPTTPTPATPASAKNSNLASIDDIVGSVPGVNGILEPNQSVFAPRTGRAGSSLAVP